MEIRRRKDQIEISELDPFLAELLRQIPGSANPEGAPAAEQRLFSLPTNRKETEICAEWKTYVEPELRSLFQTATQTVAIDLEQLNGNEKSLANRTLRIPAKHADAWLSALNQARLVIAAKNNKNLFCASWRIERRQVRQLGFLLSSYHRHEPVFDCGGGLRRAQAQRKCLMQRVAFGDEFFGLFPEFLPRFLEFLQFFWLQRADHIEPRPVLEFAKVHLSTP